MIVSQYSTADILAQAIVNLGMASFANNSAWPISVGSMPELPHNRVSVYDTTPRMDGRLMRDGDGNYGTVIEHPGVQVRVRSTAQPVGNLKASQIAQALDNMRGYVVELEGRKFVIVNASRVGGVLPLGPEPGTARVLFTVNATLTMREDPI